MVTVECPLCEGVIPPEDVNVAKDVAYCRRCSEAHAMSELVADGADEADLTDVDLRNPPASVYYDDLGFDKKITVKHRSLVAAIPLTAMALFWNGIVSVFVVFNLLNTLDLLGVEVSGVQFINSDDVMGWGMVLFMWLFLTPFIVIGVSLVLALLMSLFGKTEIHIGKDEGVVFWGFGFVGRRRRFDPQLIESVRIKTHPQVKNSKYVFGQVLLEGDGKPIKVGFCNEERQKFLVVALRHALPLA